MCKRFLVVSVVALFLQLVFVVTLSVEAGPEFQGAQCESGLDCSDCIYTRSLVTYGENVYEFCSMSGPGETTEAGESFQTCADSEVQEQQCESSTGNDPISCLDLVSYWCLEFNDPDETSPHCEDCGCGPGYPIIGGGYISGSDGCVNI